MTFLRFETQSGNKVNISNTCIESLSVVRIGVTRIGLTSGQFFDVKGDLDVVTATIEDSYPA